MFIPLLLQELIWTSNFCADDSEMSDSVMVSNVRQDLNEWQEKHAKLVLSTVKVRYILLISNTYGSV